eukprot:gene12400-15591_t
MAYPEDWARKGGTTCTSHPTSGFKGHGAPQEDSGTTFALTHAFDAVVESLCPGAVYNLTWWFHCTLGAENNVMVSFPGGGAELSRLLPYTSSGRLLPSPLPTRHDPNQPNKTGNITVIVTWSNSKRDYYHQSSVVLVLDETCKLDTCPQTNAPGGAQPGPQTGPQPGPQTDKKIEKKKKKKSRKESDEDSDEDSDSDKDDDRRRALASVRNLKQKAHPCVVTP